MAYKFLEHTADMKIRAEGRSLEEAFNQAALALKETILKHEKIKIAEKTKKLVSVSGKDTEALLYAFLEEFLYLLDAEDFIFSKIRKLKISGNNLSAEALGDRASRYDFTNEVKAITYNEMLAKKEKNKYTLQFVLDV